MNRPTFDPIGVVEAAYRFDAEPDDWLQTVSERAAAFFPERSSMLSVVVDTAGGPSLAQMHSERAERDAEAAPSFFQALGDMPVELQDLYHRGTNYASLSEVLGTAPSEHPEFSKVAPAEVKDFIGIAAYDPGGYVIQVGAVMPHIANSNPRDAAVWDRISAHISTGYRLNRRVRTLTPDTADAVLSPSGDVEHAGSEKEKETAVQEALRTSVTNLERARTEFRNDDAVQALDLWKGLVRGSYSLVDYFDTDGRRFYVARENEPHAEGPKKLSRRERQVVSYAAFGYSDKRIAYEMGLSTSSVSTYVHRAMDKLGIATRVDLVRFIRELASVSEE